MPASRRPDAATWYEDALGYDPSQSGRPSPQAPKGPDTAAPAVEAQPPVPTIAAAESPSSVRRSRVGLVLRLVAVAVALVVAVNAWSILTTDILSAYVPGVVVGGERMPPPGPGEHDPGEPWGSAHRVAYQHGAEQRTLFRLTNQGGRAVRVERIEVPVSEWLARPRVLAYVHPHASGTCWGCFEDATPFAGFTLEPRATADVWIVGTLSTCVPGVTWVLDHLIISHRQLGIPRRESVPVPEPVWIEVPAETVVHRSCPEGAPSARQGP